MVNETAENREAALLRRDAAMMLLIARAHGLVQQLALLAGSEKAAVVGLVAVGQATAAYARAGRPDMEVLASFDTMLAALSPGMAGRLAAIDTNGVSDDKPSQAHAVKELLGALVTSHIPPD